MSEHKRNHLKKTLKKQNIQGNLKQNVNIPTGRKQTSSMKVKTQISV